MSRAEKRNDRTRDMLSKSGWRHELKACVTNVEKYIKFTKKGTPSVLEAFIQKVMTIIDCLGVKDNVRGEKEGEAQNWFELAIGLPDKYKKWIDLVRSNLNVVDSANISEWPEPHVTVLYGFDPKHYLEIEKIVKEYDFKESDFEFRLVQYGDVEPVYIGRIFSPKLQECFWHLYRKYENKHTLINGSYDPHITLLRMEPGTKLTCMKREKKNNGIKTPKPRISCKCLQCKASRTGCMSSCV